MAVDIENSWRLAQESVIGSLCIDPEAVAGLIFRRARAEYFGDSIMRHLFEAAQSLWNAQTAIDPVTILHAAGGEYQDVLRECMRSTPTAANIEKYLDILRSEARLSEIRKLSSEMTYAHSEEEALDAFEKIGQLLRQTDTVEDVSFEELMADYLRRMDDPTPPNYLSWGIPQLDEQIFVSPGDFCVLGAESSTGKTALALQFAWHMANSGKRVLFFSLETPKEKLEDRLMSETQVAGISMRRSKTKTLTVQDYQRITGIGKRAHKIPLRVIRKADTLAQIQNRTIMHNADVVFIDYLQLINHKAVNRYETVTEISMALHRMAQQLGVTVIALSQVTAPEGGGKITKDNLRESGQIQQDAEIILLLMRDNSFPNARELVVGKDKDGASNKRMLLSFAPQHMTFSYVKRKETGGEPEEDPPMFETLDESEAVPFDNR